MITVTVIIEVDPERAEEAFEAICKNAAASRQEPGCLRFEVSRHLEKANVFALAELYRDHDAVEAHYGSEHFAEWKKKVDSGIIVSRTAVRGEVVE